MSRLEQIAADIALFIVGAFGIVVAIAFNNWSPL